jgi:pimeloyl-ACP methyl ester carboxylesterase
MRAAQISAKPRRGATNATSIAVVKIARTTSDRRLATRRTRSDTCVVFARAKTSRSKMLKLNRFAVYVFDYGSPTGLRMAVEHPERVTAIITQNGNAYVEGLSDGWNPIRAYWKEPTQASRLPERLLFAQPSPGGSRQTCPL